MGTKQKTLNRHVFLLLFTSVVSFSNCIFSDIPLYWWRPNEYTPSEGKNFGDELSHAVVEKILEKRVSRAHSYERKLLAIGSILQFAKRGDVVWGTGMNGKDLKKKEYSFHNLDIRALRGPLTRTFLRKKGIVAPRVYGDPALLIPRLFPELKKTSSPKYSYIVIPHISEIDLFVDEKNVVLPTSPWKEIVKKIAMSKFVISSSLHGIIVAEAYNIPARFLRVTQNEPDFKYKDYYRGTGRKKFTPAYSIQEALEMGGEPPALCDTDALLEAFPYEYFTRDGEELQ